MFLTPGGVKHGAADGGSSAGRSERIGLRRPTSACAVEAEHVVAADGMDSTIRELAGLGDDGHDTLPCAKAPEPTLGRVTRSGLPT
jgi:2-polyprenyl-6-methoxyphenol hydroxylase-like FAD-dependent oxidoreductase